MLPGPLKPFNYLIFSFLDQNSSLKKAQKNSPFGFF